MLELPYGLNALAAYRQFVVYKLIPNGVKTTKLPVDYRTGALPATGAGVANIWTDWNTAIERAAYYGEQYGVGFFFTENDPFFFIDIDGAYNGTQWSALSTSILSAFNGAYVEVSQSGKGLHIIGSGQFPPHACKNVAYGLELYTVDRFVALTGYHATGDAAMNMTHVANWIVDAYFKPSTTVAANWTEEPDPDWDCDTDDDVLIERMLRSTSGGAAFGKSRASFYDLWNADVNVLSAAFPDSEGKREYDASSADAALAQHLAFWTGKNCERMVRLMHRSRLVRDKWEREDYIVRTVLGACSRQTEVAQVKRAVTVIDNETGSEIPSYGSSFLSGDDQRLLFKDCIYISDLHRVLHNGTLLKPEQFRVMFGGYSFMTDTANGRVVRNAWEAFTESQLFQCTRVNTSCFKPDLPINAIVNTDGGTSVNIYYPVKTSRIAGDVTPFLKHLAKILPDVKDQQILLAYMAAVVQHKGIKFQWSPLIQGVEGNGKTLFTRCVAYAVGERYTHFAKASQIAKHFNGWMHGKIFIGVEDIYVSDSQREVLEELKPMITGERIEVERKGVDQVTLEVCCNFMLNSNHKDGIKKTKNDRRFAPFYSAQQEADDLVRDGMDNGYFPRLYNWLKHDNGYAMVNEFLHTYKIPDELNPANGHIAPITSSTREAVTYGLGRVEQEILEAIDRGDTGFKGGWVSSMALDGLLDRIGYSRSIAPNKRKEIMTALGYEHHPALEKGRVNNSVLPDGGKPRLYVHRSNVTLLAITTAAEVARLYALAQNI